MASKALYAIAITAIIVKDGKYLLVKRSPHEKRFPNIWTVPGGKLEPDSYTGFGKDTENAWYDVLEKTVIKEVREEVSLEVDNVQYLVSLMAEYPDGTHQLVISCTADYKSGKVKLQEEELVEFAWVNLEDAKNYELIDGIYAELEKVSKR